ncbi:MAG: GxxExxY protein [Bradymonadaceae bacterium]
MDRLGERVEGLAHDAIGAAIEVHQRLGCGYREKVYGNALALEMADQEIPFERQCRFEVEYKGEKVGGGQIDFVVGGRLIVELKVVSELVDEHKSQVISYLKGTGNELGLLLNFNRATLQEGIERVIFTKH